VPKVHGTYHVNGRFYIEMEYVEGKPFRLRGSTIFYHQPRRTVLKKSLVTLNGFKFSNYHKKR
jgi:hypothetical protein